MTISASLQFKIEGLAELLLGLRKGQDSAVELFNEIVAEGQKEGLSKDELKALLKTACERRGLSDRTYYLYLPADLKDHNKVRAGKSAAVVAAKSTQSDPNLTTLDELKRENAELRELVRQRDIRIAELEEALTQFSAPRLMDRSYSTRTKTE